MARPRRFREVNDDELKTILENMSTAYHDGVWAVRMGEFDRLKPADISRANRQLSRRYISENKEGWQELTLQLTGLKPKPLAWADQLPVVIKPEVELETWGNGPPFSPYWSMFVSEGMPFIEGYRVIGEWCPTTHKYRAVQCEKVMMLR